MPTHDEQRILEILIILEVHHASSTKELILTTNSIGVKSGNCSDSPLHRPDEITTVKVQSGAADINRHQQSPVQGKEHRI